jgi:hypothetical protein
MPQEFSSKDELLKMLRLWWVLVIGMILGGLAGLAIAYTRPPVYQAKATLYTSIDFQKINDVRLTEYDEDMTINSVQSVLLSNDVIESVIVSAAESDVALGYAAFMGHMSIYRKFTDYELFFRDADPAIAQLVVNEWADTGIQTYQRLQLEGRLPAYVSVSVGSLAGVPVASLHQLRNSYTLAGSILGLIAGIFISSMQKSSSISTKKGHR